MPNVIINDIFTSIQDYFNTEQDVREEIRNTVKVIENHTREILTILQVIHQENACTDIPLACLQAREVFHKVQLGYKKLAEVVPAAQYYRYNDHWRFVTQRLCFLASLLIFLEVGTLVSKDTVAEILGVKHDLSQGFHLDSEDYLIGVLQLCSELARFAVNSVTNGDYDRPLEISKFVSELNAAFRLLNLKNDSLRKRFDSLKYDVKKIEEIVYDITIRGLKPGAKAEEAKIGL